MAFEMLSSSLHLYVHIFPWLENMWFFLQWHRLVFLQEILYPLFTLTPKSLAFRRERMTEYDSNAYLFDKAYNYTWYERWYMMNTVLYYLLDQSFSTILSRYGWLHNQVFYLRDKCCKSQTYKDVYLLSGCDEPTRKGNIYQVTIMNQKGRNLFLKIIMNLFSYNESVV